MSQILTNIIIFVLTLLSTSCKTHVKSPAAAADRGKELEAAAVEIFGDVKSVEMVYNLDSSLILLTKETKATPADPFPDVRIAVYDVNRSSVIYEGIQARSGVEWFDKDLLKITRVPEIVRREPYPGENIYLLNPVTKQLRKYDDADRKK